MSFYDVPFSSSAAAATTAAGALFAAATAAATGAAASGRGLHAGDGRAKLAGGDQREAGAANVRIPSPAMVYVEFTVHIPGGADNRKLSEHPILPAECGCL